MKTHSPLFCSLIALACSVLSINAKAQDTIVKTNGETIYAKILEVGMNTITYKKTNFEDGPTLVDNKTDIVQVKYRNGRKEEFAKAMNSNTSVADTPTLAPSTSASSSITSTNQQSSAKSNENSKPGKPVKGLISDQHKIQTDGKKFFVNGQKIGQRDVDRLLSRSKNPAVVVSAKSAKVIKIFQKISKISAYPSTISGGVASIATFRTVFIQYQNGGAQMSSWVNAGLSFLGTLTLPITAKLLKKKQGKLYDKTIDMYNLDKQ